MKQFQHIEEYTTEFFLQTQTVKSSWKKVAGVNPRTYTKHGSVDHLGGPGPWTTPQFFKANSPSSIKDKLWSGYTCNYNPLIYFSTVSHKFGQNTSGRLFVYHYWSNESLWYISKLISIFKSCDLSYWYILFNQSCFEHFSVTI